MSTTPVTRPGSSLCFLSVTLVITRDGIGRALTLTCSQTFSVCALCYELHQRELALIVVEQEFSQVIGTVGKLGRLCDSVTLTTATPRCDHLSVAFWLLLWQAATLQWQHICLHPAEGSGQQR